VPRVSSVTVENFRAISECAEPVELGELTLVIGRNNAGKTSLLEALYLLAGGEDPILNRWRDKRVSSAHGRDLAHQYTGEYTVEALIDGHTVTAELDATPPNLVVDGDQVGNGLGNPQVDFVESENFSVFFDTETPFSEYTDRLRERWEEIQAAGIHADTADFVSESVGEEFTEVLLDRGEIRKEPDDGYPFMLDIEDLGRGVVKTIPVYTAVELLEPTLTIWDDVESSLHPTLLESLVEWLVDAPTQAVLSSHSIDVITAVLQADVDSVSFLSVRTEDGTLHVDEYDQDELRKIVENAGHDPRYLPVSTDE
jgi:energy-coupling factor transporter ATP-binding protein EcfA2